MKKLLLASAVAALSVSAAQAAPTVYGKAFLTLDLKDGDIDVDRKYDNGTSESFDNDDDVDDRSKLNSTSSRIGIKGSEALTANTDLLYQLEYGVQIDDDEKDEQFKSRDTYLGLSNKQYGTLLAGRITAIDDEIDYATVVNGGVLGGDNVLATFDGERANNTFAYFSPKYNDVTFMAMYAMDENDDDFDSFGRDAYGVGAKYETGPMNLGATFISAGDELQQIRVSGDYALTDAITLGALYQNTDFDQDEDENTFALSGKMKTATLWEPYAQLDFQNNIKGIEDDDAWRVAVGSKYKFNKATTGHIYAAYMNKELTTRGEKVIDKNTTLAYTDETEADLFGIGAGIEYKF